MLEELGVPTVFAGPGAQPLFITVMETKGEPNSRQADVSLRYLLTGS